MTYALPTGKNASLVVPLTPPPPSTMCVVPLLESISEVFVATGSGVSVSLPETTPRTGRDRS